ncbi:MAG: argininosuccinate lyase [Spirochaetaceae bacterium]|jgi:argininosuccinate lyase|uniref:Argininosuccinate lyase n=1 Tax=Sphaerochaeta halotolerans TaxID=2293840 RepID=A0A372MHM0_9SPIR|nr:argininosuccinate lyase [Sphaerochaeta halotolerans]MBG0767365.1 argininosuccinate lyase [Spirochaetaceae bacterium]RFU95269.1 argininosuccinate lyase [Sphaerochaeta halotolerans]
MSKLWQKDYSLDSLMEEFTVSNDYILDQQLVIADCLGSIAHARGLHQIGILDAEELASLEAGLKRIIVLKQEDSFAITKEHEDCHTAIEGFLTDEYGEVGKKIHTGRSRNDQVQTALRIWMREFTIKLCKATGDLCETLLSFAEKHAEVPMPGRTHMQIAMPSSIGLWAASYAEELYDEAQHLMHLSWLFDQSPLGSAASYGVPLPLDRQFTGEQMGFTRVQNNVLYANNSRGKFEAMLLDGCDYIALTLSKLAQDLILFTLPEFGYFSLPKELCTGSSIMPQKKNPDGLELARSRSSVVSSCAARVKSIIRSLPSGYNRDFQDTKEPLLTGTKGTWQLVQIFQRMIEGLQVNEEALIAGCTPELYATDVVLQGVLDGKNFRDTYKDVGLHLEQVRKADPVQTIKNRSSIGTTGNLGLDEDQFFVSLMKTGCDEVLASYAEVYQKLSGLEGVETVLY